MGGEEEGREEEGEARAGQVSERGPKFLNWPRQRPRNFFSGVGPHCLHCEWSMSLGTTVLVWLQGTCPPNHY